MFGNWKNLLIKLKLLIQYCNKCTKICIFDNWKWLLVYNYPSCLNCGNSCFFWIFFAAKFTIPLIKSQIGSILHRFGTYFIDVINRVDTVPPNCSSVFCNMSFVKFINWFFDHLQFIKKIMMKEVILIKRV